MSDFPIDSHLHAMFDAAVRAADPLHCLPPHLPAPPVSGRTVVVGAGKAAATMALAIERHWTGPLSGLVITRYGHKVPTEKIRVVEAAHPVPDQAGIDGTLAMRACLEELSEDDLVIALISGGGSALCIQPAAGLTLADKQSVGRQLLRSGATIHEFNIVRKHLSAVKGGQLAMAAAPAPMISLLISDVPGDDLSIIASGPTVGDPSTFAEARDILQKFDITPSDAIAAHLQAAAVETPAPENERFKNVQNLLIATPQKSLEAAADTARRAGYQAVILGDALEGEARELAAAHARLTKEHQWNNGPPTVFLSGGETTVTVRGYGRGGRNAEYALALALALDGQPGISAIAADTDGIDGTESNAGAIIRPDTLARAQALGLSAAERLAVNDGFCFFELLGDLVETGPTLTNVNDFRAIIVDNI